MVGERGPASPFRVGVISDTHGFLPPSVAAVFEGVSLIIHAGDVGSEDVIQELSWIAPVEVVAGNTDSARPVLPRPDSLAIAREGIRLFVTHDFDPWCDVIPEGIDIIIAGHTHIPETVELDGHVFVNPGSASRSRTADGVGTVALMQLGEGAPRAWIVQLGEATDPHR